MIDASDFAMQALDLIQDHGGKPTTGVILLQFEDGGSSEMVWAWRGNSYAALGMLTQALRNIRDSFSVREEEDDE